VESGIAAANPDFRNSLLSNFELGEDGIYGYAFTSPQQAVEIKLRESAAARDYEDYLGEVSKYHSIPVMDREVDRFLESIARNGLIVDVGGCWGWHWRRLSDIRPDVTVFIVDFIRQSLVHARKVLEPQIGQRIFLIHGDATGLMFPDNTFDGYWSVQALQHVPEFRKAISEACRILKPGGVFASYSLNNQSLVRFVCKILGRKYHVSGNVPGTYYLDRASSAQYHQIREVFCSDIQVRYTEVLFGMELALRKFGKPSILGTVDRRLSSNLKILSWIARQKSYHTVKAT
jgi:ubiquinone/menaquinone biosynthesis C-methylase UbiE